MSAKLFIDSNLLIYAHTDLDVRKQQIAQLIISTEDTVLSTQVLQETANILFKKFRFSWQDILIVLREAVANNSLHINSEVTISSACGIAERYRFSFYDSLIIAASIECGCNRLFSEDLQSGQLINNTLIIENPF